MIVVVALELAEHGCGVALIDDQDVVKQFTADSADEALGDRVRSRCPNRGPDDSDVDGGEDGIEAGSELAGWSSGGGRADGAGAGSWLV